jgi:antitoxin VapB
VSASAIHSSGHWSSYGANERKFGELPPITAWHILMYMPWILEAIMQRTAKIFMNNRSQAVRLPKEFQFTTSEVFIRRQGNDVILSARPTDWSAYLASGPVASKEFMEGVEELAVQEREL